MPLAINGIANPAPYAPTLLSPANASYQDLATTPTFSWTYNPATSGNTQSAWALRRKISGATSYQWWNVSTAAWQSTQVFNSGAAQSYQFPSASWTDGNTYNWSMATQDASGVGAYSADDAVTAQQGPTVTVTAPTGLISTGQPTVTWSATFPSSAQQTSYRVCIYAAAQYLASGFAPGTTTALYDTGVVPASYTSSVSLAATAQYLADNTSFRAYAQITETGGQTSNWAYAAFSTAYAQPPTPVISASQQTDSSTGAPFVEIGISVPPLNLLTANDASFETGIGSWTGESGCAVAQSATGGVGSAPTSLAITPNTVGVEAVWGTPSGLIPWNGNVPAHAIFSFAPDPNANTVSAGIKDNVGGAHYVAVPLSTTQPTQIAVYWTPDTNATGIGLDAYIGSPVAAAPIYMSQVALYAGLSPVNLIPDTSDLGTWSMAQAGGLFSIRPSALGGNEFAAAGTGSPFSFQLVSAQNFPASPSTQYTMSHYCDATMASDVGGAISMRVFDQSGNFITQTAFPEGQKGTNSVTFTTGSSVTGLNVDFTTGNASVPSGEYLVFAQPQLVLGSTAPSYTAGMNWLMPLGGASASVTLSAVTTTSSSPYGLQLASAGDTVTQVSPLAYQATAGSTYTFAVAGTGSASTVKAALAFYTVEGGLISTALGTAVSPGTKAVVSATAPANTTYMAPAVFTTGSAAYTLVLGARWLGLTSAFPTQWPIPVSGSYGVLQATGFDLASIRTQDVGRPRDQGMFIGLDVFGGRTFELNLWVASDGSESLQTKMQALATATPVAGSTEQPFYFKLPNMPQMAFMARARKRSFPLDLDYGAASVAKPVIQFEATDPRAYYSPSSSDSIGLPAPLTGVTFPITFPMSFGTGGTGTYLTLDNAGNYEMRPILVFTGPLTNPSVNNTSIASNPRLTFSNPNQTSYTLYAGDTLTVDLDYHTIVYTPSGETVGQNYRGWLVKGSTWFDLIPGNNQLFFSSSDGSQVAGTMEVQWTSASLI